MNYYCKYCGTKMPNISSLTAATCQRHPNGANSGRHVLYEGDEKDEYNCKYCGSRAFSISSLVANTCPRHPTGANKGRHEPSLK
jgi:DNA-directed RNA polymerase subunit RPC12/RpoP